MMIMGGNCFTVVLIHHLCFDYYVEYNNIQLFLCSCSQYAIVHESKKFFFYEGLHKAEVS